MHYAYNKLGLSIQAVYYVEYKDYKRMGRETAVLSLIFTFHYLMDNCTITCKEKSFCYVGSKRVPTTPLIEKS